MTTVTNASSIRVSPAIGGFVATLRGKRATGTTHREAALAVARQVYGPKVNVVNDYLRAADPMSGIQYRYHITYLRGAA
ncbi:hypothetical protein LCGC14_0074820 [marine sediment metagenome]|uniref:Uncharacterized protein n=1 Tax=marine sediment metagenome TaxID=412755 RepID=A0A0F9VL68_9ZZZZ|nr:hypothetical protein [Halomonas sp.]HDZ48751.1 hypothetical protein [Halomonas sp.]HEB02995.1 hypothetical protein [Halomonas sp.]